MAADKSRAYCSQKLVHPVSKSARMRTQYETQEQPKKINQSSNMATITYTPELVISVLTLIALAAAILSLGMNLVLIAEILTEPE